MGACTEGQISTPSSLSTMTPDGLNGGSSHLVGEIGRFGCYVLVHWSLCILSSSKQLWLQVTTRECYLVDA